MARQYSDAALAEIARPPEEHAIEALRRGDLDSPRFFIIDGHAQLRPGEACRQFTYKKGAAREDMAPDLLGQIGLGPWSRGGSHNGGERS